MVCGWGGTGAKAGRRRFGAGLELGLGPGSNWISGPVLAGWAALLENVDGGGAETNAADDLRDIDQVAQEGGL